MGRKKKITGTTADSDKYYDVSGQAFLQGPNIVQVVSVKSLNVVLNRAYPGIGFIPLSLMARSDYTDKTVSANRLKIQDVLITGIDMPGIATNAFAMKTLNLSDIATVVISRHTDDYRNDLDELRRIVDKLRRNSKMEFPVYDLADLTTRASEIKFSGRIFNRYLSFFGDVKNGDPVYAYDFQTKKWKTIPDALTTVEGFSFFLDNIPQWYMLMQYMDYLDHNMDTDLVSLAKAKGGKPDASDWIDLMVSARTGLDATSITDIIDEWYSKAVDRSIVEITKTDVKIWNRFKNYYINNIFSKVFNQAIDIGHIDTKNYDIKTETKDDDVSWMMSDKMWSACHSIELTLRDSDGNLVQTELMKAIWEWHRQLTTMAHESNSKWI